MAEIHTSIAALVAGLATSLHCVGMCGPLACGLGSLARSEGQRLLSASVYHGTRLVSYGVIGGICGAIGQQPLKWFFGSPAVILPWVMVAVFLSMALGLDQRMPLPAVLKRVSFRARLKFGKSSAPSAAAAMGFLTPLLPCTPLYLVFAAAMTAGSGAKGAEFTLAFGLGTVPLLWLAQQQFHRLRARLGPPALTRLRRGLALVTALVLAWRLHGTLPAELHGNPPPQPAAEELPSCCH